jgi:hypothetical protein
LIDYLNGVAQAAETLKRYPNNPAISVITWMEVMVGANKLNEFQLQATRRFLARFSRRPISDSIAEQAVTIRRERKIKLPDAIIEATAQEENRLLVTRNTRDFSGITEVVIPYSIS